MVPSGPVAQTTHSPRSFQRDLSSFRCCHTDTLTDIHTVIFSTLSSSSTSPTLSVGALSTSGLSAASSSQPAQSTAFKGASNANLQQATDPSSESSGSPDPGPEPTISLPSGTPKWHDFEKQVQFGMVRLGTALPRPLFGTRADTEKVAKTGSARAALSPPFLLALLTLLLALQLSRTLR